MPALRDGERTFALLTGIGGAGKSTLATRAANRLAEGDFRIVPVRVDEGPDPGTQGRAASLKLLTALATAFDLEQRPAEAAVLRDGKIPAAQRFDLAAQLLNDVHFLVVIDNLEPALVVETREIADLDFATGVKLLAANVTRGSRVLGTCRYVPADLAINEPHVLHIPLPDFPRHDVLKFLRREPRVDERLRSGELPMDLVRCLHDDFGGTPGFLEQVRKLLADPKLDVKALRSELEGVEEGALAERRQAYYEKIVTSRLYAALSPDAQRVASRLALSILPLPVDAVASIADLDEGAALRCLESGIEYGLLQRFDAPDLPSLFHPPGLLRPWLSDSERLPLDEAREAHRRLAVFWKAAFEVDREDELRVDWGLECDVCIYHARLVDDFERWCWAAGNLARRLERMAEWRRAYKMIDEIPELNRDTGCWYLLATIHLHEGDYSAARDKFERALNMSRTTEDEQGEASVWHQLGSIDASQGDYAAARIKFGRSLAIKQAIGDNVGEATTWAQLGTIDLSQGNHDAARGDLQRALEILHTGGNEAREAAVLHQLASIDAEEGNYAAAREKFDKALSMKKTTGEKAGEAAVWHQLASLDVEEGNYAAAREQLSKALSIRQTIGDKVGEAAAFFQLGVLADRLNRSTEGAVLIALCWLIDQSIGHGDTESDFHTYALFARSLVTTELRSMI